MKKNLIRQIKKAQTNCLSFYFIILHNQSFIFFIVPIKTITNAKIVIPKGSHLRYIN